jgi:hypothetical protein
MAITNENLKQLQERMDQIFEDWKASTEKSISITINDVIVENVTHIKVEKDTIAREDFAMITLYSDEKSLAHFYLYDDSIIEIKNDMIKFYYKK